MGERSIKLCFYHSWSGREGGGVEGEGVLIPHSLSFFARKSGIPHFFHRFPGSRFLFSLFFLLAKGNKFKM